MCFSGEILVVGGWRDWMILEFLSSFWWVEQDTAFNAMVKIWVGVGILVTLQFKLDTDYAEYTANSIGADSFVSINTIEK